MENGNSLKKLVINVKPEAENDENFSLNFPPAKALALASEPFTTNLQNDKNLLHILFLEVS